MNPHEYHHLKDGMDEIRVEYYAYTKKLLLGTNRPRETRDSYFYILEERERIIRSCMLANESLENAGERQILYKPESKHAETQS